MTTLIDKLRLKYILNSKTDPIYMNPELNKTSLRQKKNTNKASNTNRIDILSIDMKISFKFGFDEGLNIEKNNFLSEI
jgi:hypothetical protein